MFAKSNHNGQAIYIQNCLGIFCFNLSQRVSTESVMEGGCFPGERIQEVKKDFYMSWENNL